jgi:hypothetical protein
MPRHLRLAFGAVRCAVRVQTTFERGAAVAALEQHQEVLRGRSIQL